MKFSRKIMNVGLIAFAVCICFAASSFGQNAIPVDTHEAASYGIREAKLVSVWVPKVDELSNAKLKEMQTHLVFSAPKGDLNVGIILKAFSSDGTTIGQSVWCARTVNTSLATVSSLVNGSVGEASFSLSVDPSLLNAANYSMSIIPPVSNLEPGPGPETCAECAGVASGVCGTRGIKSMTCGGTSGTCTFVCNDK